MNPLRATFAFLRVLLEAVRNPEERGGPGARTMKEEWVTPILAECEAAGVAFLFKQWGGVDKHATGRTLNGTTYDSLPTGRVARMPNKDSTTDSP